MFKTIGKAFLWVFGALVLLAALTKEEEVVQSHTAHAAPESEAVSVPTSKPRSGEQSELHALMFGRNTPSNSKLEDCREIGDYAATTFRKRYDNGTLTDMLFEAMETGDPRHEKIVMEAHDFEMGLLMMTAPQITEQVTRFVNRIEDKCIRGKL